MTEPLALNMCSHPNHIPPSVPLIIFRVGGTQMI